MNERTYDRVMRILNAAEDCVTTSGAETKLRCVQLHTCGYAEPGYADPDSGIIALGDWNDESTYTDGVRVVQDNTMTRIADLFDKLGVEMEWDDEWAVCCECGKLVRTQPDGYGWTRSYYVFENEGEIVCHECADPADVLEDIEGKSHSALTLEIDPTEHGYVKANEQSYENGLYGGQNDDPKAIAAKLEEQGITRYLFKLDGVGQFDLDFSVYVHESEADKLNGEPQGKAAIDPAEACKRALQQGSIEAGKLEGEGIRYIKCNADGTATARIVTPEEFVAGIK